MGEILPYPREAHAPADDRQRDVIEALTNALALARAGQLSTVAVVGIRADTGNLFTSWATGERQGAELIGKLAVLQHDLMAKA